MKMIKEWAVSSEQKVFNNSLHTSNVVMVLRSFFLCCHCCSNSTSSSLDIFIYIYAHHRTLYFILFIHFISNVYWTLFFRNAWNVLCALNSQLSSFVLFYSTGLHITPWLYLIVVFTRLFTILCSFLPIFFFFLFHLLHYMLCSSISVTIAMKSFFYFPFFYLLFCVDYFSFPFYPLFTLFFPHSFSLNFHA